VGDWLCMRSEPSAMLLADVQGTGAERRDSRMECTDHSPGSALPGYREEPGQGREAEAGLARRRLQETRARVSIPANRPAAWATVVEVGPALLAPRHPASLQS